jgi:PAT family beta-lactamase induction signal transducer AmpG
MILLSLLATSLTDPSQNIFLTAAAITSLAIFSATQDIVIDAYRIESAPQNYQGPLSSMYIAGYRLAMLVGGAGSLWLASYLGVEVYKQSVWMIVYITMGFLMFIGISTTLLSREPNVKRNNISKNNEHVRFLLVILFAIVSFIFLYSQIENPFSSDDIFKKFLFATFRICLCFLLMTLIMLIFINLKFLSKEKVKKIYLNPIINFIKRYGKFAISILVLIGLYRIADVVMGVVANIFYLEKGFDVKEIATYSKFFGVFATILGGFLGGFFALRFGTMKALFLGALIAASSNLLFAWLAVSEANISFLITVITADNISSGFAGAAFVVYLSGLTSVKFTATQYALFSSLMLFIPKFIAGYSGSWVDVMGYGNFFCATALLGLPVLLLIIWLAKVAPVKN